jgi:hypothetical protein
LLVAEDLPNFLFPLRPSIDGGLVVYCSVQLFSSHFPHPSRPVWGVSSRRFAATLSLLRRHRPPPHLQLVAGQTVRAISKEDEQASTLLRMPTKSFPPDHPPRLRPYISSNASTLHRLCIACHLCLFDGSKRSAPMPWSASPVLSGPRLIAAGSVSCGPPAARVE